MSNIAEVSETMVAKTQEQKKTINGLYHQLAVGLPMTPVKLDSKTNTVSSDALLPSGHFPFDKSVPVMVHHATTVESEGYIEARIAALANNLAPTCVHILINPTHLYCTLNASTFKSNKNINAGKLWKQISEVLGNTGRGGGSATQARGSLNQPVTQESLMKLLKWLN